MRCLTCGAEIAEGRQYCDRCAAFAGGAPTASGASDALSKIVPYKNKPALIGYYLAVFSLIPCVGLLTGNRCRRVGVQGFSRRASRPPKRTVRRMHGLRLCWAG
jgi:hypothetical protein